MGFKATDYVEPLDYDFRPMHDYHGTITEPSDDDIAKFLRKWYRLIAEMRKTVAAGIQQASIEASQIEDAVGEQNEKEAAPLSFSEAVSAMAEIDWAAVESEDDTSPQTELARKVLQQMCRLVEDLGHGSIRADKLQQVPMRLRGVFFGWLVGELTEQGKGTAALSIG